MKSYKKNTPISNWAEDDRPTTKILLKGKTTLSNSELLAIVINTGTKENNAIELAKTILTDNNNNIGIVSKLSYSDLIQYKGIGPKTAIKIITTFEIGRRKTLSEYQKQHKITGSTDVFNLIYNKISNENFEEFWTLLLRRNNTVISSIKISEGGTAGTVASPAKIVKLALQNNASSIILAHNHPSGNLEPSTQDINLTKNISQGSKFLDIQVLDHVIVSNNNYFSFADEGLI